MQISKTIRYKLHPDHSITVSYTPELCLWMLKLYNANMLEPRARRPQDVNN